MQSKDCNIDIDVKRLKKRHIFFIDEQLLPYYEMDDFLYDYGFVSHFYSTTAQCLKNLNSKTCDLLIVAYELQEMNGIQLMKEAKAVNPYLPVIITVVSKAIPVAVSAIQEGAIDVIERPVDRDLLLSKINNILKDNQKNNDKTTIYLTKTEQIVLYHVLQGKTSLEIAFHMKRSKKTIDNHRANLMKKYQVHNIVDLAKKTLMLSDSNSCWELNEDKDEYI